MKVSLLLETIITSGVSMIAKDHGGVIDSQAKLDAILKQASYVDTGLTQMFGTAEVKGLIAKTIESRNLSALIDIVKEVAQNWPGELLQYSKDIKKMLEDAGYTTEPLYLERDGSLIRAGHVDQHLARGQVIYRLRATYVSISNQQMSNEERLRAVDVFISLLICNPHLQREVIALCLTPGVMANHLDPELPHTRLYRLRDILIKMATDELYKFPETETKIHVPELKLVEDEQPSEQYKVKPEPWLHFTGTDHLVGMTQDHGTFQEQVAVFSGLLNTKEGTPGTRLRDALAYIHRSEYQEGLAGVLVGAAGVNTLIDLNDSRLRANEVRKIIEARVSNPSIQQSVYTHPGRKPVTSAPLSNVDVASLEKAKISAHGKPCIDPTEVQSIPMDDALRDLLAQFGDKVKVIPLDIGMFKASPQDAIKSVMAQLGYMKPEQRLAIDECKARVQAALPELFNEDSTQDICAIAQGAGKTPKVEPAPIQISGGDAQMRADIEALFAGRGRRVVFTDRLEVPKLTFNEVHTYQCQVGNAIVALQHNPLDKGCKLTAHPVEGKASMKPLNWQAPTEHVPEIWDKIRSALNHHDAYWRITRFLDEAGYDTY